ncbi:MAG: hypothetical protein VX210_15255 [Myxococcota bacterium]|nr:hypothetical protein [Myxococcota bacterium]
MTHFELNHRTLPSTLEIIREARGLIYGHKLRIFGLWFGVSIANQVAETILKLEGDTGLSFLIKFAILMVLAMLSHNLVVGMPATSRSQRIRPKRENLLSIPLVC